MPNSYPAQRARAGDSLRRRLYLHTKIGGADECWIWTGAHNMRGYGQIHFSKGKRVIYAHRASYEIHRGPIPDGLWVLHRCDNPQCVNPSHLFLGDRLANVHDAMSKGRMRKPPIPNRPGELNPNAKLTDKKVRQIQALLQMAVPQRMIGLSSINRSLNPRPHPDTIEHAVAARP